jgi:hypothetical protein
MGVSEPGKGRDDEVKGGLAVARLGERVDDAEGLDDRPRPPVRDQQRTSIRPRGPDMEEVDAEAIDDRA